jgi:type IV pilus assembly protein PilM
MQKVIGLDIGSYSIKAVEIVNTLNSYEITNFYENVIPQIDEIKADVIIPACMEQLFAENQLEADRIVTAMPGQYVSSRIMQFSFSDPSKIASAIISEVEDQVPYNLDDMIVDHQILGPMGGKTAALVVMTKKTFLRSFLDHLQRINIDPKLIDIDSLAFYNLFPFFPTVGDECISIVDIGHDKTSVCIIKNGVLRMFRSINLGGRYLSEFLARDLEVSFNEAQRIKHQVSQINFEGLDASNPYTEENIISYRLTLACNAIIKELGRTFYAFKTWEEVPISRVYLSGGSSRIAGLDRYIQEQLEVQVVKSYLQESTLKIVPELLGKTEVMSQGVAIGMRAITSIKRATQINFRKGEFAYVQDYEALIRASGMVFKLVAAVLLTLSVLYALNYASYRSKTVSNRAAYERQVATALPKAKLSANMEFSALRKDVNGRFNVLMQQKRNSIENFMANNRPSPALRILAELSSVVDKSVKMDFTQYDYINAGTGGKLMLRGETDSYESVAKIVEKVKGMSLLSDTKEQSQRKPGSGETIEFTINATYQNGSDGGSLQ